MCAECGSQFGLWTVSRIVKMRGVGPHNSGSQTAQHLATYHCSILERVRHVRNYMQGIENTLEWMFQKEGVARGSAQERTKVSLGGSRVTLDERRQHISRCEGKG